MTKASLLVPLVFLISICLPFGMVMGDNDDDTSFFDIGNFAVTRDGGILGTYIPRVLEGVTISLYSETGEHIMDILYQECCIDVYIEIFNDALIQTLLERGILEKGNLFKITFSGKPQMAFTYENCTVELQDATISFLRIQSPGKIVFSNLSNYDIVKTTGNIATLTNDEFYGTLRGHEEILVGRHNITTEKSVTFRGMPLFPENTHDHLNALRDGPDTQGDNKDLVIKEAFQIRTVRATLKVRAQPALKTARDLFVDVKLRFC